MPSISSGSLFALGSAHRALRFVEALGLIVLPFIFNLLVALGADWHMAEIAKLLPPLAPLDFRYQVLIGRAVALFAHRRGSASRSSHLSR